MNVDGGGFAFTLNVAGVDAVDVLNSRDVTDSLVVGMTGNRRLAPMGTLFVSEMRPGLPPRFDYIWKAVESGVAIGA